MEAGQRFINSLTDKDYQLVSKVFRRTAQLFYENNENEEYLTSIVCIASMIPEIVASKNGLSSLTVASQMQILKAKTKGHPHLKQKLNLAIDHLKSPRYIPLSKKYLIEAFAKEELFTFACTIALRFLSALKQDFEMDWKQIIDLVSQNIDKSPYLSVELLIEVCKQNEQNARLVSKSGIIKYIFVDYLQKNLKDKFNLYRGIKLVKATCVDKTVVRQREKTLANIIYTYENYIPVISEISSRCYESQYCNTTLSKNIFQASGIDYPYVWSYVQQYSKNQLHQQIIARYLNLVSEKTSPEIEAKIFAICSNYSKFCKSISKQIIKMTPKYQQSLLNYLKMCYNMSQIDITAPHFMVWPQLNELLLANSNPKAQQIANYLKELMTTKGKVGSLNHKFVRMFAVDKNADMLFDAASRVPKNNQDLDNLKTILKQKVGTNELDSDTLNLAKQKALQSLRKAVANKRKLDLNSLLTCLEFSDVYQAVQFLKTLQMYLTIFLNQIQSISKNKVFEIIQWIQDHYTGEIIDWGAISQLLLIFCDQDQWKTKMNVLKNYCFWILSIDQLRQKDEQIIWNAFKAFDQQTLKKKLPFVFGFLGKIYSNAQKANCLKKNSVNLQKMVQNIVKNQDYNINLMMLAYFLKGWGEDQEAYSAQKNSKPFQQLMAPTVNIITSHSRQSPQENYFLQCCLPFKINTNKLTTQLQSLIKSNGKLAAEVYTKQAKIKKGTQIKINNLENQSIDQINNVLTFSRQCPNAIKPDSIIKLVDHIEAQPCIYWQLFPRYLDIMTAIVDIVGSSESQQIKNELSNVTSSLIKQIITNQDITDDERHQLLEATKDSLQNLSQRRVYLDIQRVKKTVTKIVDQELREEIIIILNNYKIKESKAQPLQIEQIIYANPPSIAKQWLNQAQNQKFRTIPQPLDPKEKQFLPNKSNQIIKQQPNPADNNHQNKEAPLQKMFQSIKLSSNLSLIEAFEILKKIDNGEIPFDRFNDLYSIFLNSTLNTYEKELLGILLTKIYDKQNCQKILSLILNKQKTHLSQNQIFQLVSKHIPAFAINRREKLHARQYLNIAMARVNQGFFAQGCEVINYNLTQIADLQYFYNQKHHNQVITLIERANLQDQVAQLLLLIGRAAKFPQIKTQWLSKQVHLKIMKFILHFPKSTKVIANLSFAETSLTSEETKACNDLVNDAKLMYSYLESIKEAPSNTNIAHYASEFLNNLSLSESFATNPTFDVKKVISTLKLLFQSNMEAQNLAPYKYILKAIGFLSLNYSCQFLQQDFCQKMVLFHEKIDIISSYDQKKAKIIHLLVDLIINLSKNKEKRMILHHFKITLLTVTLLQTTQTSHAQLIASFIDCINALCQQPAIQTWYVHQKRLPYILLDILKLQSEENLVLKAMRMAHNITLNVNCIPLILKSNILGVIGNIVVPHIGLHRLATQNEEFCKKVQSFIIKMIAKIYEAKPPLDQILKSGFLECLVRIIEMTQFEESFLDILFFYSSHIPNFLNRRTFSTLLKILTMKINDKKTLVKCLQSLRNILSFSYQAEQEDNLIQGISEMYLKFISTQFTQDALFLLFYHLMRSQQFRQVLRLPQDKIKLTLIKLSEQQRYKQICRSIVFLIYSPPVKIFIDNSPNKSHGKQYEIMRAGIRCWLFRADGSYKEAKIDIDQEYNFRVYKFPDGELKEKYTANIRHIRQFQVDFQNCKQLWANSLFEKERSLFHTTKPENCCTLIGNKAWGSINFINIQFFCIEDKILFFACLTYLLTIFRL